MAFENHMQMNNVICSVLGSWSQFMKTRMQLGYSIEVLNSNSHIPYPPCCPLEMLDEELLDEELLDEELLEELLDEEEELDEEELDEDELDDELDDEELDDEKFDDELLEEAVLHEELLEEELLTLLLLLLLFMNDEEPLAFDELALFEVDMFFEEDVLPEEDMLLEENVLMKRTLPSPCALVQPPSQRRPHSKSGGSTTALPGLSECQHLPKRSTPKERVVRASRLIANPEETVPIYCSYRLVASTLLLLLDTSS